MRKENVAGCPLSVVRLPIRPVNDLCAATMTPDNRQRTTGNRYTCLHSVMNLSITCWVTPLLLKPPSWKRFCMVT